jgi:hypothetical protein
MIAHGDGRRGVARLMGALGDRLASEAINLVEVLNLTLIGAMPMSVREAEVVDAGLTVKEEELIDFHLRTLTGGASTYSSVRRFVDEAVLLTSRGEMVELMTLEERALLVKGRDDGMGGGGQGARRGSGLGPPWRGVTAPWRATSTWCVGGWLPPSVEELIDVMHFLPIVLLVKVGFIESVHTLLPENLSTGSCGSLCYWGPIKSL